MDKKDLCIPRNTELTEDTKTTDLFSTHLPKPPSEQDSASRDGESVGQLTARGRKSLRRERTVPR